MSERLAGKVAIVTGSGIREGDGVGVGRAMATLFAREGARVLVVDREMANAEKTLAALEEEGLSASAFEADVSVEAECEAMVAAAVDRYGKLDVLGNAVGIGYRGKVTEMVEADWDRVLDVDLKSCAMASKHAIPAMVDSGGGVIMPHFDRATKLLYLAGKGDGNIRIYELTREFLCPQHTFLG